MDIWLDTTKIKTVQKAVRFGLLSGVTTNPSLIAESKRDVDEVLEDLLHYQEGPVAVQVVADETAEMVQQGQNFYSFSNRLIIKVPLSKNGLEALQLLSRQGMTTMATAIFSARQGLMAALAGADYIAPYVGRIENNGGDPWSLLKQMTHLLTTYRMKTKILAASLNSVDHVLKAAETGIYGVTVRENLFEKLIESDPQTLECMEKFAVDWKNSNVPQFIP